MNGVNKQSKITMYVRTNKRDKIQNIIDKLNKCNLNPSHELINMILIGYQYYIEKNLLNSNSLIDEFLDKFEKQQEVSDIINHNGFTLDKWNVIPRMNEFAKNGIAGHRKIFDAYNDNPKMLTDEIIREIYESCKLAVRQIETTPYLAAMVNDSVEYKREGFQKRFWQ